MSFLICSQLFLAVRAIKMTLPIKTALYILDTLDQFILPSLLTTADCSISVHGVDHKNNHNIAASLLLDLPRFPFHFNWRRENLHSTGTCSESLVFLRGIENLAA